MDHWLLYLFPRSLSDGPGSPSRFPFLVLLVLTACFLWQCENQEKQPSPSAPSQEPVAAKLESAPAVPQLPVSSTGSADTAEVSATSSCCEIVDNPDLKGRLGRLVVNFPEGANPGSTRIDVFKPGEQKALVGVFGGHTFDLLPGIYEVEISQKRLAGVSIQSAHDTRVKVGVLKVYAGGSTRIDVIDRDGQSPLAGGFGDQTIGLPIGPVQVKVAGQMETVTIEEGKVTEF